MRQIQRLQRGPPIFLLLSVCVMTSGKTANGIGVYKPLKNILMKRHGEKGS